MANTALTNFLKKHPNFTLPKVGMDFTIGYGSDRYAWHITAVDPDCKGFTAVKYRGLAGSGLEL